MSNRILIKNAKGTTTEVDKVEGITVTFHGRNNLITIEEGSVFKNCRFNLHTGCSITIDKTEPRGLNNTQIDMRGAIDSHFSIGEGCSIEGCRFVLTNEKGSDIKIGKACLFSANIIFRANDGHTIFDIETGEVVNYPEKIIIGDHVWVGANTTVMKGAHIPNNAVLGQGSLIARKFWEENVVIAGNPAKIIRHKVNWDRRHIKQYEQA